MLEIVPALAYQVTDVVAVPLTCAVNCCWPCDVMVAVLGEIESVVAVRLAETRICARVDPFTSRVGGVGVLGKEILLRKFALTVPFGSAQTLITKLYVPPTVGVPVIEPVAGLRLRPGGRVPFAMPNWYGGVPPLTESTAL